jgi:outer membrane lipoprotein SlyB
MTFRNIIFSLAAILLMANCSQNYSVIKAPHRKAVTDKVAGVVQHSHPIKVSKNYGVGQTVGGLGGAFAGASFGAGTGRYIGAVAGRFIGAYGGKKAESRIRQKDAQEVMVELKGKSHKFINTSENQFKPDDKIWADTNIYGEPLTVTPR